MSSCSKFVIFDIFPPPKPVLGITDERRSEFLVSAVVIKGIRVMHRTSQWEKNLADAKTVGSVFKLTFFYNLRKKIRKFSFKMR